MAVMGDHHNSNWSQARYFQRKHEESVAREKAAKAARHADVIDAEYTVIENAPSLPSTNGGE